METSILLQDLIKKTSYCQENFSVGENIRITGVALDSRRVKPGYLFVASRGRQVDGHNYISQAIENGAVAVIGSMDKAVLDIPYLQFTDTREALAEFSAALYDHPARSLTVIGVTGTDGKTTTTNFIFQCLRAAGIRVGMVSTVNAVIGDQVLDTGFHVTTPEAPDVQKYLAQMVESGLTHVVLEVTSHGLEQKRVANCEFDIGVVTNIAHEHLDYHGSYDAYLEAKQILFEELAITGEKETGNPRLAVLNADDRSFQPLNRRMDLFPEIETFTYGVRSDSDVQAKDVTVNSSGVTFTAVSADGEMPVQLQLFGEFNVSNALAAIAACKFGLRLSNDSIRKGIESLEGIPGRMEWISLGQSYTAIVDFAHTPNALEEALKSAKKMASGRVIAVFGSAGLRDQEKRWMMAEIAAEYADLSVLTAEDPRTEDLDQILVEMEKGMLKKGKVLKKDFWVVRDRGDAIRFAIDLAGDNDLVIACGKGHEQSMCFETTEYPWDDRTAMKAALSEQLGLSGPEMPYLPTSDGRY